MNARGPFVMTLVRCLRSGALAAITAAVAAYALTHWLAPALDAGASAPAAAVPWLELALLAVAATTAVTAIMFWPTFAARTPGADVVVRLQRGPLRGSGAAIAAALTAQLLLSLPLTTLLARALGAPPTARAYVAATAVGQPLLESRTPRLPFTVPGAVTASGVELRPLAGLPAGALQPSRVVLVLDGVAVDSAPATFEQTNQLARFAFAPTLVTAVELRLEGGNVPLLFPPGAVTLIESAARSTLANGCIAALLAAGAAFVSLAFACLAGVGAARPTVITVVAVLLFLTTVGRVGPGTTVLLPLLRGQWIPGSGVFTATLSSLAAGSAAMILTMLLRRRTRA